MERILSILLPHQKKEKMKKGSYPFEQTHTKSLEVFMKILEVKRNFIKNDTEVGHLFANVEFP